MSKKPQNRLVSKRQYIVVMGKGASLISLGIFVALIGFGVLFCSLLDVFDVWGDRGASWTVPTFLASASIAGGLLTIGITMFFKGTKTEPVELLRAAQYEKETQDEELLKAAQENR